MQWVADPLDIYTNTHTYNDTKKIGITRSDKRIWENEKKENSFAHSDRASGVVRMNSQQVFYYSEKMKQKFQKKNIWELLKIKRKEKKLQYK